MAFISGDIKNLLTVKSKVRPDDYTDQFSRIFIVKMCLVSSLIIGFDYFKDEVACIKATESKLTGDFISATCWIKGNLTYFAALGFNIAFPATKSLEKSHFKSICPHRSHIIKVKDFKYRTLML